MWKMVVSIIKAIFTKPLIIIKGTFNNIFNKHQDLASKRLKICMNCEYRVDIPVRHINQHVCAQCGCVLESKTTIADEKCEMNKW